MLIFLALLSFSTIYQKVAKSGIYTQSFCITFSIFIFILLPLFFMRYMSEYFKYTFFLDSLS